MTKKTSIFLTIIVLFGLYLRVFNFPQTLNMDTDQGAALLIADRIINHHLLLLVGPLTSLWQVNLLPPIYYYLIAGLYFLFQNELLVTFTFTAIGILSIPLIYFLGRELFDAKTGLITALLFASSEAMVWYSRNFWEPYLIPFLITLSLLFLFAARRKKSLKYFFLSIVVFFTSFLYVSSFILLPVFFYLSFKTYRQIKPDPRYPFLKILFLFILFLFLTYLPVIAFETSNNYPSLQYLLQVIKGQTSYLTYNPTSLLYLLFTHIHLFLRSLFVFYPFQYTGLAVILITSIIYLTIRNLISKKNKQSLIILTLILGSVILTSIYQGQAEVYRLACLYPAAFLLFGYLVKISFNKTSLKHFSTFILSIPVFLGLFLYITNNTQPLAGILSLSDENDFRLPYQVAAQILDKTENKSFTIYTVTPDDKSNHHSTSYWWALEKLSGKPLARLNHAGNWINQDLDKTKNNIFLICRGYNNEPAVQSDCLKKFIQTNNLSNPDDFITINNIQVFQISKQL